MRFPKQLVLISLATGITACSNENNIKNLSIDKVAVTTGDFDRMEEPLVRADVVHDLFEGYIRAPLYEPDDVDPSIMNPKAEELFTGVNDDGYPLINEYDAVLINSGTRGLGAYVYNAVDADDAFLIDPRAADHVDGFVAANRSLVATDWAYDLIEAVWPDKISFYSESDGFDAAQAGVSGKVTAEVLDKGLADLLGSNVIEIDFGGFSAWTVISAVDPSVDVYISAAVEVRDAGGQGAVTLYDVPLMVGFESGGGRVVYSAFPWKAQPPAMADLLLGFSVDGLDAVVSGDQYASQEVDDG
mgnify:CR=1 FL=1